jgi:hypothetical protein
MLSADAYLEATQALAEDLEGQADNVASVSLLGYGLHWIESNQQSIADDYVAYKAHELISRIYEHLGLLNLAYDHLRQAQRKAPSKQKKPLSHRCHELHAKYDAVTRNDADIEGWHVQVKALLNRPAFCRLVDVSLFHQFLLQTKERARLLDEKKEKDRRKDCTSHRETNGDFLCRLPTPTAKE